MRLNLTALESGVGVFERITASKPVIDLFEKSHNKDPTDDKGDQIQDYGVPDAVSTTDAINEAGIISASTGDLAPNIANESNNRQEVISMENTKKPFHEKVAEKLIEQLKQGTAPWQKPWTPGEPSAFSPMNPTTGKRYRGINALILMSEDRSDQRWLTYKQAAAAGAQVRKGEKGTAIQYWKFTEEQPLTDADGKPKLDEKGEKITITVKLERPRGFSAVVFNAEQIDGLPPLQRPKDQEWNAIERAEMIMQASGAVLHHGSQNAAFYRPSTDTIHLPDKNQFESADRYYATALHELGHWSGHPSRLDRDLSHPFGSEEYAKEELRAEIASMLLGNQLGIGHDPGQHAAYVKSWISVLQNDSLEIFRAAADAEKIQGFIIGLEQQQIQEQVQNVTPSKSSVLIAKLGKSDFAELANHIAGEQTKNERVGDVRITNCQAATTDAAIAEVLATQHMNSRAESDKTYHLLVSFRAGEQPGNDILHAIEDRICAGLGYEGHQRISSINNDTGNHYIHIAINKIHSTTHTIHEPDSPYRTLGELCQVLEREYGLAQEKEQTRNVTLADLTAKEYQRLQAAEEHYHNVLVRVYGETKASEERYKSGHENSDVQAAKEEFLAASAEWHNAITNARKSINGGNVSQTNENNTMTAYQTELARLLKLSTLTPGNYLPSEAVKNTNHAAVFVGDRAAILTGPSDDPLSVSQADALAASTHVQMAFKAAGYNDRVYSGSVVGSHIKWDEHEFALVSKPSNQVELGDDGGPLVAIVLNDPRNALTTSLCVNTETARILDPAVPELDNGKFLSSLASIQVEEERHIAAMKTQKHRGLAAHEITSDEFIKVATAIPLVNHGRRWEIFVGEQSFGFADSETADDAIRETHKREVNNALYSLSKSNTGSAEVKSMPPIQVLKEYPELVDLFKDDFDCNLTSNTFIHVPFKEKDEAKALGAKWSREEKSWYVPAGVPLSPFQAWNDKEHLMDKMKSYLSQPQYRFEIHDPSMDTTFRFPTANTAIQKAEELGLNRFQYLDTDSHVTQILKVADEWKSAFRNGNGDWDSDEGILLKDIQMSIDKASLMDINERTLFRSTLTKEAAKDMAKADALAFRRIENDEDHLSAATIIAATAINNSDYKQALSHFFPDVATEIENVLVSGDIEDSRQQGNVLPAGITKREYLAVPYSERFMAKELGALWDKEAKSWYIGPNGKKEDFKRWMPDHTAYHQGPAMRPQEEFGEALQSLGCVVDGEHPIMDGRKHRITVTGDKRYEKSGFYVGHVDGRPAGYIKNNRTGVEMTWKSKGYSLSSEDKAVLQAEAAAKLLEREKALKVKHNSVAAEIAALLSISEAAPADHPYLLSKQARAGDLLIVPAASTDLPESSNILIGKDWKDSSNLRKDNPERIVFTAGDLLVPAYDVNGTVWSAQSIQSSGMKMFAKDSLKQGNFNVVGGELGALVDVPAIVISEGYATADSLSNYIGFPTVSAFDSGNLEMVTKALHEKYPEKPIVIAGDDDKHLEDNPGRTKAIEAATAVGGKAIFPIFAPGEYAADPKKFSDFNDLATKSILGVEGLKRQVCPVIDQIIEGPIKRDQQQEIVKIIAEKQPELEPIKQAKVAGRRR